MTTFIAIFTFIYSLNCGVLFLSCFVFVYLFVSFFCLLTVQCTFCTFLWREFMSSIRQSRMYSRLLQLKSVFLERDVVYPLFFFATKTKDVLLRPDDDARSPGDAVSPLCLSSARYILYIRLSVPDTVCRLSQWRLHTHWHRKNGALYAPERTFSFWAASV